MPRYLISLLVSVCVLISNPFTDSSSADTRQSVTSYDIGGGLRLGIEDDNADHLDTVYIQLLVGDFPLAQPATDEPMVRGQCTVRFDPATGELQITHKNGKQWTARFRKLNAFGRSQVPGLEVAWRANDNEAIYGLGERFDALNVAGRKIDMWIVDEPGQGDGSASYFVTPVLYSSAGYGFFAFHNPEGEFDLNSTHEGWHRYQFAGNSIYFWVTFSPDVPTMIRTRTDVMFGEDDIGLPSAPDWAYMPWISRNSYENQQEAEAAMDGMRQRNLPFGVIVLEAWKGPSETGEFNRFDKTRWPDVEGFFQRCERDNVKVVLWQVPILHPSSPWFARAKAEGYLVLDPEGNVSLREGWLPGFANIDFTNDRAAEFYKEMLRPIVDLGVAGFKADDGESIKPTDVMSNGLRGWDGHNLYSAMYNQATYEVLGGDGMIWARSGSVGLEESPGLWAGDQSADWFQLRRLITAGLSSSLSGMPFWGHDIGGYYGHCTPELYIRWLQFGAFSPFMQFHGIEPREPWHFGEEAVEAYRVLAYQRLLIRPTLIELGHEAAETGMPIMRPMFFVTGEHEEHEPPDQYLLGDNLLVAPVLEEHASGRVVRFPTGRWLHALSPMVFDGPGEFSVPIGLVDAPLFIREGTTLHEPEVSNASLEVLTGNEPTRPMVVSLDTRYADRPALLNVQAPLRGKIAGEKVVLRFHILRNTDTPISGRWRYTDKPDEWFDAPVGVSSAGEVEVDLTPERVSDAVGRRQLYELFSSSEASTHRLIQGEVDWDGLIRVEVDDPYRDVVTAGQTHIRGHVENRTRQSREVNLHLVLPDGISADSTNQAFHLAPGQSRTFDWSIEASDADGFVGDDRVMIEARVADIAYDRAESAVIRSPRWLVAGPFPALSKAHGFHEVAAAQWTFDPDARFPAGQGLARWQAIAPDIVAEMDGLNFNTIFGEQSDVYAYATTLIHSDRDHTVQLRAGSDDTLSVWVNGELVHDAMYDRAALPDQQVIDIQLNQGVNRILIKVAQGRGGWALLTRLTDTDGDPVSGLTDALQDFGVYGKDRASPGRIVRAGGELIWHSIGPFAYDPESGVAGPATLEQAIEANRPLPEEVSGKTWEPLQAERTQGRYDLSPLSGESYQLLYCTTTIDLAEATEIEVRSGSDDGLIVWVDGRRVIDAERPRAFVADEDTARIKLDQGSHRLVARISQGHGDWAFEIRLWDVGQTPARPLDAGR